jgi:hypothetical protein
MFNRWMMPETKNKKLEIRNNKYQRRGDQSIKSKKPEV